MGAPFKEEDPFSSRNMRRLNEEAIYWERQRHSDMMEREARKQGSIEADYRTVEERDE